MLKNEKETTIIQDRNELKLFGIMVLVVLSIFFVFYGITLLLDVEEQKQAGILEETIQYQQILVGQILNQDNKDYYVLVKNDKNLYNSLYEMYLADYVGKKTSYYTVDLNDNFNLNYRGEKTIVKGKSVSEFRFADTTLIKIKNKKVTNVYTTNDEILAELRKSVA